MSYPNYWGLHIINSHSSRKLFNLHMSLLKFQQPYPTEKRKSRFFHVKNMITILVYTYQEKRTEINIKHTHSYIAGGSIKYFTLHWETFLAIFARFTKAYILLTIILNLGITLKFTCTYINGMCTSLFIGILSASSYEQMEVFLWSLRKYNMSI